MAAILLVGIVAYTQLPVSALPEVDYPTIQVLTFYPGSGLTLDRSRIDPDYDDSDGRAINETNALTESFDTTDAWMGTQHALLVTVALAQK